MILGTFSDRISHCCWLKACFLNNVALEGTNKMEWMCRLCTTIISFHKCRAKGWYNNFFYSPKSCIFPVCMIKVSPKFTMSLSSTKSPPYLSTFATYDIAFLSLVCLHLSVDKLCSPFHTLNFTKLLLEKG